MGDYGIITMHRPKISKETDIDSNKNLWYNHLTTLRKLLQTTVNNSNSIPNRLNKITPLPAPRRVSFRNWAAVRSFTANKLDHIFYILLPANISHPYDILTIMFTYNYVQ